MLAAEGSLGLGAALKAQLAARMLLLGPQEFPKSRSHIPNTAIMSVTSNIPQHDLGNHLGLSITDRVSHGQISLGMADRVFLMTLWGPRISHGPSDSLYTA